MRVTSVAVAAGLALASISTSLHGQGAQPSIDPRSQALYVQAKAARAAGDLDGATDLLETAAAVDPRNRPAFVLMAEISAARGLPGKAIRLYREALLLDPSDIAALKGQGDALVAKGAVAQARENLRRIRALCKGSCPPANQLAATIAKGPPIATAQATPTRPAPVEQ